MEPSRLVFRDIAVAGAPRVEFCLDPEAGDPVAGWLLEHDWIDEPVMRAFQTLVTPGAKVLDLGCHLGTFSLPAAALGADVLSVDASARHTHLLGLAARRNGFSSLSTVHGAISESTAPVRFVGRSIHGRVWRPEDSEVPYVTGDPLSIDDLLDERGWDRVDVVKMDIEGSEPIALRTMRRLFERGARPAFLFECNGAALPLFGSSIYELRRAVTELGYELLMIDHLRPGTLVEASPDGVQPECVCDYLALVSRPEALCEAWAIETPFGRVRAVTRWLEAAAESAAGYRLYSARVLSKGPAWLGREPLVAPALMALQEDESETVREALLPAAAEEWVRQAPAPVAGGALPAEVAVLAEELALRAQAVQPERPADPDGPAEEICLADATFHVCAGRPLAVIDDDRGTGRRLLRVIAGLERSAGGRLEVRRRAALLSDIDDVFEPDLTVIENALLLSVYLGADVRTAAPVVGIAAEDAGVDGQLEAPLRELGAEQQARLAVAVAIECVSPQLLLIGRLPAIADGAFIARVRQRTAELAGSGAAVIQLVRDAGELLIPARSALWLHDGRIRSHGHAASVLATARAARAPVVAG